MKLSKLFIPLILCQVAAFPLLASEPTAEEIRLQNQYIEDLKHTLEKAGLFV